MPNEARRMRWRANRCETCPQCSGEALPPCHNATSKNGKGARPSQKSLPLEGKVPNEVRRMRWGANRCAACSQWSGETLPPCHNAVAKTQDHAILSLPYPRRGRKMPPHQSAIAASFPSRGSLPLGRKQYRRKKHNKHPNTKQSRDRMVPHPAAAFIAPETTLESS